MCGFRHRAMEQVLTPCYGASFDTTLWSGSNIALWIPSGENPISVQVLTSHYGAGFDIALWIVSGGKSHLGTDSNAALW